MYYAAATALYCPLGIFEQGATLEIQTPFSSLLRARSSAGGLEPAGPGNMTPAPCCKPPSLKVYRHKMLICQQTDSAVLEGVSK